MDANDDLTKLVEAGPNPAHELQHLVMTRFTDITTARKMARTWQEIAATLGLAGRQKALAAAYWRVKRGVEAGRLTVAAKPMASRHQVTPGAPTAPPSAPPASTKPPAAANAEASPPSASTPGRRVSAREALAAARQYNYPTRK